MGKARKKPCPNRNAVKNLPANEKLGDFEASTNTDKASHKQVVFPKNKPEKRTLDFFSKFHVWDFITAPAARGKLDWITCLTYPLSPQALYERWKSEDEIVGVRFPNGKGTTSYALLDVDADSEYHPDNHNGNFAALLSSMGQIGLLGQLIVRSSFSGGIHVYFPFPEKIPCYKLALAIESACREGKFSVKLGTLEVFPNVKSKGSNYKAHRLPLQLGSCVLDDFGEEEIHADLNAFINLWEAAASRQDMHLLKQAVGDAKPTWTKQDAQIKGTLAEWKARLEKSVKEGWTGSHQTNDIIKEACIYARVFLEKNWDDVESWALQKLPQLPGFQEFCAHRHNYQRRVRDWVRLNQRSNRYYPCSQRSRSSKSSSKPSGPDNSAKAKDALQRIQEAIARLQSGPGGLPSKVKERQELICREAGCSATTLRKHLCLWHPHHLVDGDSADGTSDLSTPASLTDASKEKSPIIGQGCVTAQPARLSSHFEEDCVIVTESAETTQNQVVTHPRTLTLFNDSRQRKVFVDCG